MSAIKRIASLSAAAILVLSLAACGESTEDDVQSTNTADVTTAPSDTSEEHEIVLSDDEITLDGQTLSEEDTGDVTISHDIVYYEEGQGAEYGEGTEADEHSAEDAQAHTVLTIRAAGTYRLSGTLSQGQIAVDLGDEAKDDPSAVVTLILDNVDVTCTVAPALIFYNVYECSSDDAESASSTVDTTQAGANVIIADGTENTFTGSYVARIYEEGTTDKLHKYDGAFYSKMSMNIGGEDEGTGVLNIIGDNEGLDTEMHLTINGGVINIESQNDGINTNEDNVSVTTINGGTLTINAGLGTEGDGIDSNGWLVINGGNIYASANAQSADSGLDATNDILINGGTVVATGNMSGGVSSDSVQVYKEFAFSEPITSGSEIVITDSDGTEVLAYTVVKDASQILISNPDLVDDAEYTVTVDGEEREYTSGNMQSAIDGEGMAMRSGAMDVPDGFESWLSSVGDIPDEIRTWLEGFLSQSGPGQERMPDNMTPPSGEVPPDAAQ